MVGLSLLAVIKQECERASKPDDDKALGNAIVNVIVVLLGAGHGLRHHMISEVVVTFAGMVVRMRVFEEVGDPFTKGAVLAGI